MTLDEAIKNVLEDKSKSMTAQQIAEEINQKGLYKKNNGDEIAASNIMLRVKQNPNLFIVKIFLVEK